MKLKMLQTLAKIKNKLFSQEVTVSTGQQHKAYEPPKGVLPAGTKRLAMDSSIVDPYAYLNDNGYGVHESFPGYPALAELTQRAEYRMLSEKKSEAMVRKWIKFSSKGTGDKTQIIKVIEDALLKFKVREQFEKCATYDGFFGRCQLFIDVVSPGDNTPELRMKELPTPLMYDNTKIGLGSLRKFKVIDPIVTYPNAYNASNPLSDDYYRPETWYVMGQIVHHSRLLMFLSREVPDLLKPSYNFGGMSMSQLARPYVENWLRARTAVGRLLRNFSTSIIKTNMESALGGIEGSDDSEDVFDRAELFTAMRDNQGLMVLDKDSEDFEQVNTSLTTVDKLQAQAQEQMASVSSTPLVVLTGITPAGLNASSDGEIRIWYDHILSQQMKLFNDPLKIIINVIMLSELGYIDPDITFEFVSLWQMDTKEMAAVRKSDAEAAQLYFAMGAISPDEVRSKLASDPESGFSGLSIMPNVTDEGQPPQS